MRYALTIDPKKRLEQENQELRNDYIAGLEDVRKEIHEVKQWLTGLEKGNRKELVGKFWELTANKIQDEWYDSDEYRQWQKQEQKQKQKQLQSKSENKKND